MSMSHVALGVLSIPLLLFAVLTSDGPLALRLENLLGSVSDQFEVGTSTVRRAPSWLLKSKKEPKQARILLYGLLPTLTVQKDVDSEFIEFIDIESVLPRRFIFSSISAQLSQDMLSLMEEGGQSKSILPKCEQGVFTRRNLRGFMCEREESYVLYFPALKIQITVFASYRQSRHFVELLDINQ